MNPDHLAKEAARLKADPIFNQALDDIRAEALDALAECNPEHMTAILRLQQRVSVVNEIRSYLDRYIMAAGTEQEQPGSFA